MPGVERGTCLGKEYTGPGHPRNVRTGRHGERGQGVSEDRHALLSHDGGARALASPSQQSGE
jgi:hypothetical protein